MRPNCTTAQSARRLFLDRPPFGEPAAEPARQRADVPVAHLLEVVAHERAAKAAAAVADDRRVLVGDLLLDVALDDSLAQMDGAADARLVPLAILARVHEHEALAGMGALDIVGNGDVAHALLGVLQQGTEAGGM